MPACCLKVIATLVFAGALLSTACESPTGPAASATNQPVTLRTLGPSQSQLAAEAVGQSPQDFEARGWDCRPSPIPNRVSCSPPNQMHPLLLPGPPPPADRPPTFTLLLFDNGVFIGTDLLIRSDLYRGQQCNATGAPYRFISRIGYYECLHPVNGG
jgi:hypothetical protein